MNNKIFSTVISISLLFNPVMLAAYAVPQQSIQAKNQQVTLGNKYAKEGHDAYSLRNFLKSAQSYEKAYQVTKYKIYLDNAIAAYTSYAFDLTNEKKYDEAIKYCNKILSLRPGDKTAKEALADIYFSRGADYFYTGELEKAKQDLEASSKYSVLKEQIDRVKDGLAKVDAAMKSDTTPVLKYNESADASVPEIVSKVEAKIYGKSNDAAPLLDRINKLEKETLGKTYESDGIIIRVDRLKRSILPEYAAQTEVSQRQSHVYDDTYIREIIDQSMGRVTIFGKMPITVYFDEGKAPESYKKIYIEAAKEGFKEWEKASDNRVKFEYITMPAKADIQVKWTEEFEDFPWKPTLQKEDISAEKERMKYRKAGAALQVGSVLALLAGALVPPVGIVGAVGSSLASPYLQYKGTKIEKLSPDLKIATRVTEGLTDEAAKARIKQMATHQMGHAIGVYGHSLDPNDIMFGNFTVIKLSERDINTIKEIYKPKEPPKEQEPKK